MTRGRGVLMTFGLSEAVATRHCRAPTTSHRQATAREKVVSMPGRAIRGIWYMSTPFARRACQTACMGMLLVGAAADPQSARAFDWFGLFGSDEELPIPSAGSLPYTVMIQGIDNDDVLKALKDTSTLYRLRQEAPPDGEGIVRRAEEDLRRLSDAISGFGYYGGRVSIHVDGVILAGEGSIAAAARAAEASRNRALVSVKIVVKPGPLYMLRSIRVRDLHGHPFADKVLPARFTRVAYDVPARSATVLAREASIIDRFRSLGHPFAKTVSRDPVVDDAAHVMDVTFLVDPGPIARIGEVAVRGTQGIDPAAVRSFIYT